MSLYLSGALTSLLPYLIFYYHCVGGKYFFHSHILAILLMCLFFFLISHFVPLPLFSCIISIVKVRRTLMLFFCFCPCYIGVIKSAIKYTYCSPNTFCSHLVLQDHELPSLVFFFFSSSCFRAHLRLPLYLLSFRSIALPKLPACVHVSLRLFSIQLCCCCCFYLLILFFICLYFILIP